MGGVTGQVAPAFLAALTPISAGATVLQRGLQLAFDHNAKLTLPALALPVGNFIGWSQPIPIFDGTTTPGPELTPCKFAFGLVLTHEMLHSPSAETLIRSVMIEQAGASLDLRLFDNTAAVYELRPAGLLNALSPIAATAGGGEQAMIADLANLSAAVAPYSGNGGLIFVTAPKQWAAATLWTRGTLPWTFLQSAGLADGTLIALAANNLVVAMAPAPQIEAAQHSITHMEDASPQPIMDGVLASPVFSRFQTDSVDLKLRWPLSWAARDSRAIAYISGASWPA
jgi:hypothetical protein